jgi:hypothetical protein
MFHDCRIIILIYNGPKLFVNGIEIIHSGLQGRGCGDAANLINISCTPSFHSTVVHPEFVLYSLIYSECEFVHLRIECEKVVSGGHSPGAQDTINKDFHGRSY